MRGGPGCDDGGLAGAGVEEADGLGEREELQAASRGRRAAQFEGTDVTVCSLRAGDAALIDPVHGWVLARRSVARVNSGAVC